MPMTCWSVVTYLTVFLKESHHSFQLQLLLCAVDIQERCYWGSSQAWAVFTTSNPLLEESELAEMHRCKITIHTHTHIDKSWLFLKPSHLPWMDVEPNKALEIHFQHLTHEVPADGLQRDGWMCWKQLAKFHVLYKNVNSVCSLLFYAQAYY